MTEREYLKLREMIQKRYEQDMEALDRVWTIACAEEKDTSHQSGSVPFKEGSQIRMVYEAVKSIAAGTEFDMHDISGIVIDKHGVSITPTTISGYLLHMVNFNHYIGVVEKGVGKRPTKYVRKPDMEIIENDIRETA